MTETAASLMPETAILLARKDGLIGVLQEALRTKDAALGLLEEQVKQLKRQIEWMKRQMFGRKSEKIDPNQMLLDPLIIEAV